MQVESCGGVNAMVCLEMTALVDLVLSLAEVCPVSFSAGGRGGGLCIVFVCEYVWGQGVQAWS